jgi:hypothetical protein
VSTDWYVHCRDCDDTHRFEEANHLDEEMASLCKHAAAIAGLAPLFKEVIDLNISLYGTCSRIDPAWFAAHLGHRLIPISEYGHLLDQCLEYVACACGSSMRCTKDLGHDGDHDPTERTKVTL